MWQYAKFIHETLHTEHSFTQIEKQVPTPPIEAKRYAFVDGHFGPFRWLGDIDDHNKW